MKGIIQINYLFHSGFLVETEHFKLIFDYYIDQVENGKKCSANGAIGEEDLNTDKKILVFASHKHPDHFNPVIFEWSKVNAEIEYILGNDIKRKLDTYAKIHRMPAYKDLELSGAKIKTFGSTDAGVSFLIELDGTCIFHAGDLNWWHWYDATEQENKVMAGNFKAEIEKIKEYQIDLAFFPVDKRLKEAYCIGAEYFIDKVSPAFLIPMHFGNDYDTTKEIAEKIKNDGRSARVIEITRRGQELSCSE